MNEKEIGKRTNKSLFIMFLYFLGFLVVSAMLHFFIISNDAHTINQRIMEAIKFSIL